MDWNVADAKNKLSEVLNRADHEAPQVIRRRERNYIVMSSEHYRKLTGQVPNFLDDLIDQGPRFDEIELMPRHPSPMRDVDL